jgi:hypothetical protein
VRANATTTDYYAVLAIPLIGPGAGSFIAYFPAWGFGWTSPSEIDEAATRYQQEL